MEENLFCKYCGKLLDDDSAFCPKCGKPIQRNPVEKPMATDRRPVTYRKIKARSPLITKADMETNPEPELKIEETPEVIQLDGATEREVAPQIEVVAAISEKPWIPPIRQTGEKPKIPPMKMPSSVPLPPKRDMEANQLLPEPARAHCPSPPRRPTSNRPMIPPIRKVCEPAAGIVEEKILHDPYYDDILPEDHQELRNNVKFDKITALKVVGIAVVALGVCMVLIFLIT